MLLEYIKIILEISDTSNDQLLTYHINAVKSKIHGYCNIDITETLPEALNDVIVQMVVERYKNEGVVPSQIATRLGDTSFDITKLNTINELDPHKSLLNRYRRVKFV